MVDPKDGGAWYPSYDECRARVDIDANIAPHEQLVRNAIDLYRERGGQVGGDVEREALADMLGDARNELDMTRAALGVEYEPHQSPHERTLERVRELIARQSGAQPDRLTIVLQPSGVHLPIQRREDGTWESVDRGDGKPYFRQAKVADDPVAWRFWDTSGFWQRWKDGKPYQCDLDAIAEQGLQVQYAYSHPATVPAEVMAAAEWLPDWTDKGSQQGAYATLIRDWFRSIQGVGHVASGN